MFLRYVSTLLIVAEYLHKCNHFLQVFFYDLQNRQKYQRVNKENHYICNTSHRKIQTKSKILQKKAEAANRLCFWIDAFV